ncbi:MAG: hypothetical protein ABSC01_10370 [Verrucomicrobiota bacterium]
MKIKVLSNEMIKSRFGHYLGRNVSNIYSMWMKTGQSSSANFRPISRIQSAPHMLKKRYDEQNTVAGSDVEFADLWSCRQIARGD